jgi:hypothetical protein
MLMADGEVDDWDDLPEPLVDFIQHQDGLKFNGGPISSRDALETAYSLLTNSQYYPNIPG